MITFKPQLRFFEEQAKGMKIKQAKFRAALKEGVELGVDTWFKVNLIKHFTPSAVNRYQYAARTNAWNRRKNFREMGKDSNGRLVPLPKPSAPNVYTGEMMRYVVSRQYDLHAKWSKDKLHIRVVVPIPHPIRVKYHNEITRVNKEEYLAIGNIAFDYASQKLGFAQRQLKRSA